VARKKELTEWHRVVFYRKLAEIAGQYLKKGSQAYVEGRLQTRKWQDKDGAERYTTEIIADTMQMLGSRQNTGGGNTPMDDVGNYSSAPQKSKTQNTNSPTFSRTVQNFSDIDDDIPF